MVDYGNEPATKADLQAVRSDLPADLQAGLQAVRSELKEDIKRVAVAVVKTQFDILDIKHDMATKMATKDDINRVFNAIDAFANKSDSDHGAVVLHDQVLTEIQVGLKDHEKRLTTLESSA